MLDRIVGALAQDPGRGIEALLRDLNWRPNLVAACAYLLDTARTLDPGPLWTAIDHGSWVSPQLVVTALFVDPGFADKARARVADRCRLSADAASGEGKPSPKNLASLLAAARMVPSLAEWHATTMKNDDVLALLGEDGRWDRSPEIVTSWMETAVEVFARREIVLRIPQ